MSLQSPRILRNRIADAFGGGLLGATLASALALARGDTLRLAAPAVVVIAGDRRQDVQKHPVETSNMRALKSSIRPVSSFKRFQSVALRRLRRSTCSIRIIAPG